MPVRLLACAIAVVAGLVSSAAAAATPSSLSAWYMYGNSASELRSYAYAHGCAFAQSQPGTSLRVLLLDFGAARKLDSATWGAVDFSNTRPSSARHRPSSVCTLFDTATWVCRSGSLARDSRCVNAAAISPVTSTCRTPPRPSRVKAISRST